MALCSWMFTNKMSFVQILNWKLILFQVSKWDHKRAISGEYSLLYLKPVWQLLLLISIIIPHVKIVCRDWLTKVCHSIMSTGEMSTGKTSTVLTGSTGSHCCFHWYFTKLGLFGIIKQICHASVVILMECLPSGGWFSLGLRPRENHPPFGRHFIRIPTLAWHICIMYHA